MTGTVLFDPLIPLPLLIGLAVLAAFGILLALWRGLSGWALRGLAAAVVLAALAGPSYQTEDRAPLSDIVLLLEDESASQRLADRADQTDAAAEAMALARRSVTGKRNRFFVDANCFAQTKAVVRTRASASGVELVIGDAETEFDTEQCFAVLLQYPCGNGEIKQFKQVIEQAHANKAMVIFVADILSLLLLKSPGELGADVVVGNTQRFGVPMGFGGPHAAYMATRTKFQRSLPGRLVGVSVDAQGKPAYRLALQTREQHIRREKATSNICTNSGLCCLAFTIHMSLLGDAGIKQLATLNHENACLLADTLDAIDGVTVENETFFNEFTVRLNKPATDVIHILADKGIIGGVPLSRLTPEGDPNLLLVCATETSSGEDIAAFGAALKEELS